MAISVISSITKTASGTVAIPIGCVLLYAVVKGSETAPSVNSIDMTSVATLPANGQVPALAIWKTKVPVNDTVSFLLYGTSVEFIFLSRALDDRGSPVSGYDGNGTVSGNLTTTVDDLVIGVVTGVNSPVTLKGDTVEFTYLINELKYKIGYIVPGDASLSVVADDPDTTSGYWQDQEPIYHGSELVTAAWVENLTAIHHNGRYTTSAETLIPVWIPAWDEYPQIYHPAVYSDAWTEYPPAIYINTGVAGKVNAIFCSVKKSNPNKTMRRWL